MLMYRFEAFRSLILFLCCHCIHVIDSFFLLSLRWCDMRDFSFTINEGTYFASFRSQNRLGSNYSSSRFIYILLRQC